MIKDLSAVQCRMGRAALNWSLQDLVAHAQVGSATISKFEGGLNAANRATRAAIRRAFETAGLTFIAKNGGGEGVRLVDQGESMPAEVWSYQVTHHRRVKDLRRKPPWSVKEAPMLYIDKI